MPPNHAKIISCVLTYSTYNLPICDKGLWAINPPPWIWNMSVSRGWSLIHELIEQHVSIIPRDLEVHVSLLSPSLFHPKKDTYRSFSQCLNAKTGSVNPNRAGLLNVARVRGCWINPHLLDHPKTLSKTKKYFSFLRINNEFRKVNKFFMKK